MRIPLVAIIAVVGLTAAARAQDAGVAFFEAKVRPVLVAHCYECHSAGAKKIRGKLLLDSRAGVRAGGVSGPAVVPGDPDKSLLIQAIRFNQEDTKMPPKGKLPASVIADLETWVKMGAPDPRDQATTIKPAKTWDELVKERRQWWSLQPVTRPGAPRPKNAAWPRDPVDRFLLAKLEAKGLTPAADADPHTLIRRLSLVLTGLPPTVDEVAEFVRAAKGDRRRAVEALVDRLLASPHFGERWARHWMDVVRFTETHGNEWNYEVHHAWRYRDYLIRAFNDDVPYDQLVREHIAGDLIRPIPFRERGVGSARRFNEWVIGTAFYRFGEVNHDDCIGLPSIGYDLADNQIDTLSKAFQAMTIACARCHDHKLDAISQRDYHALLGILRSSRQVAHTIDAPDGKIIRQMQFLRGDIREELGQAWLAQARRPGLLDAMRKLPAEKLPLENPLAVLQRVEQKPDAWNTIREEVAREIAERKKFNESFTVLADFRGSDWPRGWQFGGHAFGGNPSPGGGFTMAAEGNTIASLLPAGAFTHALSEKLNGVLRSPVLSGGKKYISFHVMGERASAVRLVSNNCQLNYRNYRYLTKGELHWITFPIPENADSLRVYAELMTKFDNPKFPDQLGTLGGDKLNYRIPWQQAAADPRSYFGITHVVLHDQPAPPKADLSHLKYLIELPDSARLARRFQDRPRDALLSWQAGPPVDDEDILWINAFLRQGLLTPAKSPKLDALIAEYRKLEADLALPRIVPGLADAGPGFDQPIFARGDCTKPGQKAPRGYVEVLAKKPFVTTGSGRLELANLIAARDNPLTARVMVNRVWHHLFGAGLVRTVDDFGHVGELPSHPELLDHLASRFMDDGWSIKRLIRAMVLSRAFQLAHTPSAAALEADPENRLLQHYPARRMEAEAIRDAILAASGRLDRTLFGMSVPAYREKEYADRRLFRGPVDGEGRRSIYVKVTLMEPPRFLDVFNFPGGKVTQGRRDVTNVPAQALAMLNDPFVIGQADEWGKRLSQRKEDTLDTRIHAMFCTAFAREPRPDEVNRFRRFAEQAALERGVADVITSDAVWSSVAHAIFNVREFITIP